ncbi:hypothetical protein EYF80_028100 [Liparis tanakae]|uniref:Uncharacterized protein n=1 Tax=Liparis tanakae TaxID=230148 RepID=A0A4Z2H832_9TELE|nr:hypothetical protein EYF80_028100 [Liparis tanakae]
MKHLSEELRKHENIRIHMDNSVKQARENRYQLDDGHRIEMKKHNEEATYPSLLSPYPLPPVGPSRTYTWVFRAPGELFCLYNLGRRKQVEVREHSLQGPQASHPMYRSSSERVILEAYRNTNKYKD